MLFNTYINNFYYKINFINKINLLKKIFTLFVGFSFLAQSIVPSYATDITIDPSSGNTFISSSINGTPVLNIATPTGNGVSHNKFKNFNVSAQNLVVNNSADAGISKLGGGVLGNINLQKGNEARLILNEVTGATRSQLTGAIELFGSSVPLVLANPNGITCNGCGFINTPKASLITGSLDQNRLHSINPQFDLSQESVQIGPDGLNFGDATSGEIISRLVDLNGEIHGGAVDVVTGYGKYDFQSKSFAEQIVDDATKPGFSIDSTLLGGIYAGRISLVANENGVGVKAPDNMSASLGDMRLTADGQLIVKNLDANGSVYLESKSDNIDLQGTIATKKNINATAQDITLIAAKEIAAKENINISATNLSINADSKVVASGSIEVNTVSHLENAGAMSAAGQLNVTSQDRLTNSGDMTGDIIDITADGNFDHSGNIEALKTAKINATSTMNMSGNILSLQDVILNSHQLTMSNTANLKADEDIELVLTQDSTLDGEIVAGQNVKVTTQNNLTSNALLQAPNMEFAIGSNFTSTDRIISGGDLTFTNASSSFTNEGEVVLSGTLSHEGKVINADGGKIVANDNLTISVNALENAGDIDAKGLTITSTDTIENTATGTIDAGDNGLTINVANNLTNAGQVQTEGILSATARGLTNSNNLFAARSLNLSLTDAIDNTGTITGDESLTTSFAAAAATPLVTDGQWISSGDLSLTGLSDWTNSGLLMVKGDLIVEATGDVVNSAGSIIALNDLSITGEAGGRANSITNASGLIQSDNGTVTLKADTITNTRKDLIVTSGLVFDQTYSALQPTISTYTYQGFCGKEGDTPCQKTGKRYHYSNGQVSTGEPNDGVLPSINSVPGASISGAGYAYMLDGSTVIVPHPDRGMDYAAYYDEGPVRVQQYKTELAGGARGTIQSGQNIVIDANTLNNNYSTIAATGDIDISGGDLNNSGLALTSQLYFSAYYGNYNRCFGGPCKWFGNGGGRLLVETTSAGIEAATIQAGGNVNLNLTGTVTNNSDIESGMTIRPDAAVLVDTIDKGNRAALDYSSIAQGASLAAFNGVEGNLQANPKDPLARVETSNSALHGFLTNNVSGFDSLFAQAAPNQSVLFETRFAYADLGQFYGSDYFISSLPEFTIDADVKRLGDSYLDTRLIHEQIMQQTGKRWLDPSIADDSAQMKNLLDAGIQYAKDMNISPGVWLTQEQINNLNQDLVWYVEMVVEGQRVLVPKVYLASTTNAELTDTGAVIAAVGDLTVTASEVINKGGDIIARNAQITAAGNIVNNSGRIIAEKDVTLTTLLGDVINTTDTITAVTNLNAAKSILYKDGSIQSGEDLTIDAANDVYISGANTESGEDTTINAQNNIVVDGVGLVEKYDQSGASEGFHDTYTKDNLIWKTSSIKSGGNLNATANNDISLLGAQIEAAKAVNIDAGNNLTVGTLVDQINVHYGEESDKKTLKYDYQAQLNKLTSIKAGEEISLKARKDLELVGSKLEAGEDIFLEATEGGIRLLTARDSTFESLEKNYEGKAWFKMHSQGEIAETVSMVLMEAQGSINFKSAEGITVEYRESGNLLEDAAALSKLPGLEWMEEALEREDIDWVAVQEHYESWDEKNEGMTGAAMAVVAIAVAVVTAGAGAAMLAAAQGVAVSSLGTVATAVANAGFTSMVTTAATATINSKGKLGAGIKAVVSKEGMKSLLSAVLVAGITAGVTNTAGAAANGSSGANNTTLFDMTNLESLPTVAKNQLINAAVKASVNSAIYGGDFGENMKDAFVTAAINVASSQIYNMIGDFAAGSLNEDLGLSDGFKLEDGSVEKILLHAVAGCGIGEARSGGCFAGAIGAGLQEALGDGYASVSSDPQMQAQLAGLVAAVAVALSGGDADAVNTANATAYDANLYNRQLHTKEILAIKEKAEALDGVDGLSAAEWQQILGQEAMRLNDEDNSELFTALSERTDLSGATIQIAQTAISDMIAANDATFINELGQQLSFLSENDGGRYFSEAAMLSKEISQNAEFYNVILKDSIPPQYDQLGELISPSSLFQANIFANVTDHRDFIGGDNYDGNNFVEALFGYEDNPTPEQIVARQQEMLSYAKTANETFEVINARLASDDLTPIQREQLLELKSDTLDVAVTTLEGISYLREKGAGEGIAEFLSSSAQATLLLVADQVNLALDLVIPEEALGLDWGAGEQAMANNQALTKALVKLAYELKDDPVGFLNDVIDGYSNRFAEADKLEAAGDVIGAERLRNNAEAELISTVAGLAGTAKAVIKSGLNKLDVQVATNRLPDFQHGIPQGEYDAINPGPLDDGLAGTFSGGKYTEVVLDKDVILHRAGTEDTPLGQFFTQNSPDGVLKTRIDSAVLPEWPGGGASPIDSAFEVKIPAGTRVYVGEVGSQGGIYVGGTQQIVVPKPWLIEGVQVIGSKPLQ